MRQKPRGTRTDVVHRRSSDLTGSDQKFIEAASTFMTRHEALKRNIEHGKFNLEAADVSQGSVKFTDKLLTQIVYNTNEDPHLLIISRDLWFPFTQELVNLVMLTNAELTDPCLANPTLLHNVVSDELIAAAIQGKWFNDDRVLDVVKILKNNHNKQISQYFASSKFLPEKFPQIFETSGEPRKYGHIVDGFLEMKGNTVHSFVSIESDDGSKMSHETQKALLNVTCKFFDDLATRCLNFITKEADTTSAIWFTMDRDNFARIIAENLRNLSLPDVNLAALGTSPQEIEKCLSTVRTQSEKIIKLPDIHKTGHIPTFSVEQPSPLRNQPGAFSQKPKNEEKTQPKNEPKQNEKISKLTTIKEEDSTLTQGEVKPEPMKITPQQPVTQNVEEKKSVQPVVQEKPLEKTAEKIPVEENKTAQPVIQEKIVEKIPVEDKKVVQPIIEEKPLEKIAEQKPAIKIPEPEPLEDNKEHISLPKTERPITDTAPSANKIFIPEPPTPPKFESTSDATSPKPLNLVFEEPALSDESPLRKNQNNQIKNGLTNINVDNKNSNPSPMPTDQPPTSPERKDFIKKDDAFSDQLVIKPIEVKPAEDSLNETSATIQTVINVPEKIQESKSGVFSLEKPPVIFNPNDNVAANTAEIKNIITEGRKSDLKDLVAKPVENTKKDISQVLDAPKNQEIIAQAQAKSDQIFNNLEQKFSNIPVPQNAEPKADIKIEEVKKPEPIDKSAFVEDSKIEEKPAVDEEKKINELNIEKSTPFVNSDSLVQSSAPSAEVPQLVEQSEVVQDAPAVQAQNIVIETPKEAETQPIETSEAKNYASTPPMVFNKSEATGEEASNSTRPSDLTSATHADEEEPEHKTTQNKKKKGKRKGKN